MPRLLTSATLAAALLSEGGCSSNPEVKQGHLHRADLVCGHRQLVVRDLAPEGQRAPTPKAAAAALARPGEQVAIASRFSGTAKLLVRRANGKIRLEVTVVRAAGSWAATKVAHCP